MENKKLCFPFSLGWYFLLSVLKTAAAEVR